MKRKRNLVDTIVLLLVLVFVVSTAPSCAKPKLPVFEFSNLAISNQEVNIGQSTTVTIDVSNSGEVEGTCTVILKIDGTEIDDTSVILAPGVTQGVSFSVVKEEGGIYTVDVNGLTATFKVLKPAEFKTEGLVVTPTEMIRGSSCKVTVDVTNIGEVAGNCEVKLSINDEVTKTREVTLVAGATETLNFTLIESEAGTYNISVNGLSEIVTVKPRPAWFSVGKLTVLPEKMPPGSSSTVTIEVTNTGDVGGTYEVTLRVNDEDVETKNVTVAGGTTETVTFILPIDEEGTYDLSVNGHRETLTVMKGALPTLDIGDQWVYRLVLDGKAHTMTQTITGEEKLDGRDCYVVETTFEPPLEGWIPKRTEWWEKSTYDRIRWQFEAETNGVTINRTHTYSYGFLFEFTSVEELMKGIMRWPREVGNEWTEQVTIKKVDIIEGDTTTEEIEVARQYEVAAIEAVTTSAGDFECFKIVVYSATVSGGGIRRGQALEEIWYSDQTKRVVKYRSLNGSESWELLSYSIAREVPSPSGGGTVNGRWTRMTSGTQAYFWRIWGTSSSDVFVAGGSVILHYDGQTWRQSWTSPLGVTYNALWGTSSSSVFAVGNQGAILRYNGSTWTTQTSPTTNPLWGVWGTSASDVFAVGWHGTILHYDGVNWQVMSSPESEYIWAVWGTSSSDVFASGSHGVFHYDGDSWTTMNNSGSGHAGIWGTSSSDVFVVGWNGQIMHYDGVSWQTMTSGSTQPLQCVWGSSSSDVYAVGHGGTILHYDGNEWSSMDSGTTENLWGIWGSSAGDIFAVGENGTILHYTTE